MSLSDLPAVDTRGTGLVFAHKVSKSHSFIKLYNTKSIIFVHLRLKCGRLLLVKNNDIIRVPVEGCKQQ